MLSVQTQSEHLESSAFLRKYAIQIVQHARDLPILDVGAVPADTPSCSRLSEPM